MIDSELIKKIEEELFLYYNKRHQLSIQKQNLNEWETFIKKVCNENDEGVISIDNECLYENEMNYIINLIKKYNKNFKLHSSSIVYNEQSIHPYSYISRLHEISFPNEEYIISKNLEAEINRDIFTYKTNNNKKNKFILSARNRNPTRDFIFQNLNLKNSDGIVRYREINSYQTTPNLLNEYDFSYISFILENCVDPHRTMGKNFIPMTEKTLLGFYFKTIPIIYGCKGLNNTLLDLGFWTANKLFNFDDTLENSNHEFINLVSKINKMSLDEITELYDTNKKYIQNNYNILISLFDLGRKYNKNYIRYI